MVISNGLKLTFSHGKLHANFGKFDFLFFLLKTMKFKSLQIRNNHNPLLSKYTLKYLVYCLVIWIEVWRLQNQFMSIWALVFYY